MLAQTFLDNLTGVPQLWACIKAYIRNYMFDTIILEINMQTGHLVAQESGNIRFSLDSKGHLISEVT